MFFFKSGFFLVCPNISKIYFFPKNTTLSVHMFILLLTPVYDNILYYTILYYTIYYGGNGRPLSTFHTQGSLMGFRSLKDQTFKIHEYRYRVTVTNINKMI